MIHQSKRNIIVVRESNITEILHKKKKQIYIWWGGKKGNAGLMLALAYMLQTSPEWKGSELIIKTLVKSEEDKVKVMENLEEFFAKGRLRSSGPVSLSIWAFDRPGRSTVAMFAP